MQFFAMIDEEMTPRRPRFLIAVLAYNRPASLRRLLESLGQLEPSACDTSLVISIDGEGNPECEVIARGFEFALGPVEVCVQDQRLGLRQHVLEATDRVSHFDAIIVLEDDLSVSPWMLHYCVSSFAQFGRHADIAQISLYSYPINEFSGLPFVPVCGGVDNYYARVPSSWGQLVSKDQWQAFRSWQQEKGDVDAGNLPVETAHWLESWKRSFYAYVSSAQKWVFYPERSLTTNHCEPGQNYSHKFRDLEAVLETEKRDYTFAAPDSVTGAYDEFYEPVSVSVPGLSIHPNEIEFDLNGLKPLSRIHSKYLVSCKTCTHPIAQFSSDLRPLELNIRWGRQIFGPAEFPLSLGLVRDFRDDSWAREMVVRSAPRVAFDEIYARGNRKGRADIKRRFAYKIGSAVLFPFKLVNGIARALRKSKRT